MLLSTSRRHPLTVVLTVLTAVLLLAMAAGPAVASAASDAQIVRLVEHPDGRMEVVTGTRFASLEGRVVAKEADVLLYTTGLLDGLIDTVTGLANDTMRRDQWNLDAVQAEASWSRASGAGQVIAIIDSGVDGAHQDLRDRLVPGYSALGGNPLVDGLGHGTHVAGTAAATAGNGFGVAGLAHAASIMPVQVTDSDGSAFASDVAEGLIWAVDNGATVANLSLAGTRESAVLSGAIDYAVTRGVVVVVAAGNEFQRGNPVTYPAAHPQVIAVAAMRDASTRSAFSSTGDFVDIAAPGSSILSTRPNQTFGYASGTSMAAPLVAGATALLRSANPSMTVSEIRGLLLDNARDTGPAGWDAEYGHGMLDIMAALEQITATPTPAPVPDIPEVEEVLSTPAVVPTAPAEPESSLLSRVDGLFSTERLSNR